MEGTQRRERAEQYAVVGQAVALYARLAETGERQQIFRDLTVIELKHAAHWESTRRYVARPSSRRLGPASRLIAF